MPVTKAGIRKRRLFVLIGMTWSVGMVALAQPVASSGSWLIYLLYGAALSGISTQIVARIWEKHSMLRLHQQFSGFICGETIFLPIAIMALMTLASRVDGSHGFLGWGWWTATSFFVALIIAAAFRKAERQAWQDAPYYSASKTWHDWFGIFGLAFAILKYSPAAWYVNNGAGWIMVMMAAIFLWAAFALLVDSQSQPLEAHWRQNWDAAGIGGEAYPGVVLRDIYR